MPRRRTQTRCRSAKEERTAAGAARNALWQALTPTAQLMDLDTRLGAGKGATRQRKLLAK